MENTPDILAVVGPTASAKTALALELAEALDTEIISADSMQFYKGMAIGASAPTAEERARVKHHFVGFLEPAADFSAGAFEVLAREVVASLNARGKIAIVVGGSGLYIRALIDGLFPGPGKNPAIRDRLQAEASEQGVPVLFARLQRIDPDYAQTINPNDLRRIVRALEVHELEGKPLSVLHREHRAVSISFNAVQVALNWPREQLYERINARVDLMLEQGLIGEVQTLLSNGYEPHIERLRALGYREIAAHLRGACTLEEAIALMKQNTRQYAKRQLTWFRADERINGIPASADIPLERMKTQALALLQEYTKARST